jgi:hypothetical protein
MSDTTKSQLSLRDIVDLEAWLDPSFKEEVQSNPAAGVAKVAEKYGIDLPDGVDFRVVSDSDTEYHLVLSTNPAGDAPAAAGSEVSGYISRMIVGPTPTATIAGPKKGSSYTIFCNPSICKVVAGG